MGMAEHIESMDLAVLSHLNTGEDISYRSGVLDLVDLTERAIFDAAYEFVSSGYAGSASVSPALFCKLSDLNSDPDADKDNARVTVDGVEYQIRDSQPDGKGGTILKLHRVKS